MFDIICLWETYLKSSLLHDDSNLEIPGYNLVHFDLLSNKKRGGVCIYYKLFAFKNHQYQLFKPVC